MSIVFKDKDGSVATMTLVEGADKEEAIRKFREAHPGRYLEHFEGVIRSPASRQFRDAWTIRNTKGVYLEIEVDDIKAKGIHLSRIREARNKKLVELDVETIKAATNMKLLKEVEAKKQLLRDLPNNLTVDSKAWPEIL